MNCFTNYGAVETGNEVKNLPKITMIESDETATLKKTNDKRAIYSIFFFVAAMVLVLIAGFNHGASQVRSSKINDHTLLFEGMDPGVPLIGSSGWDAYLENLIGHSSGQCDKAAIITMDGAIATSTSASNGLAITSAEADLIGRALRSEDYGTFQQNGIWVEGVKYQFLRSDDNVVYGKMRGKGGITLQGTRTLVVIGHTKEGGSMGNVNKAVGVIAEYLESLGY